MRKSLKRYRVRTRNLPRGDWVTLHVWGHSRAEVRNRFDENYKGWSYSMPQLKHIVVDHF